MDPSTHTNHFLPANNTLAMIAFALFIALLIIVVILWCDLRLQRLQQPTDHSTLQTELLTP